MVFWFDRIAIHLLLSKCMKILVKIMSKELLQLKLIHIYQVHQWHLFIHAGILIYFKKNSLNK